MTLNILSGHLTLWYFLTFSDGFIVFIMQKILQMFQMQNNHDLEVKVTPNKALGIVFITLCNFCLSLYEPKILILNFYYFSVSIIEYFLLESARDGPDAKELN